MGHYAPGSSSVALRPYSERAVKTCAVAHFGMSLPEPQDGDWPTDVGWATPTDALIPSSSGKGIALAQRTKIIGHFIVLAGDFVELRASFRIVEYNRSRDAR